MKSEGATGALRRAARMGRLGLGLAGSYIGYQLQNLYLSPEKSREKLRAMNRRNSRLVREELQDLRGPAMKLGQALSMQGQVLPPEIIQELAALQMQAPAMHPTLMRVQFRSALGKEPEELFRSFEPDPFAAASLGQVHRAVTPRGDPVAVKIQYPAIREVIVNDFKILRTVTAPAGLTGHLTKSDIDEIERGIVEETDYANEARNVEFFRRGLKPLPFVDVPKVHHRFTKSHVITLSLLDGLHLGQFLATRPSQSARDRVGTRILELFCYQLHGLGALHADPHPGNYLFTPEGDIRLLDFGCIKYLSQNTRDLVTLFGQRAWNHGAARFDELVRRTWGAKPARNSRHSHKAMKDVIAFFELVYPPGLSGTQTVNFASPCLLRSLSDLWNGVLRHKLLNPEFFFSSRTELGLYNLLYSLKAKVPTTQTLHRVLDHLGKPH